MRSSRLLLVSGLVVTCAAAAASACSSTNEPDAAADGGSDGALDDATGDGGLGSDGALADASGDGDAAVPCAFGPMGQLGGTAAAWAHTCAGCTTTLVDATATSVDAGPDAGPPGLTCGSAVRATTDAPGVHRLRTPAAGDLNLDVTALSKLRLYVRASNPNASTTTAGWQGLSPVVILRSRTAGELRFEPSFHAIPYAWEDGWQQVEIALAGDRGWARAFAGDGGSGDAGAAAAAVLADVDEIEIVTDTQGTGPYTIDIAGLTFLGLPAPACDEIVQDFTGGSGVAPWQYGTMPAAATTFASMDASAVTPIFLRSTMGGATYPFVARNFTRLTPEGLSVPPGAVVLHPGSSGERAVVRWTARQAGTYEINATFGTVLEGTAPSTTDVHVLQGATALFDGVLNIGDAGATAAYIGTRTLAAGETLDFVVGRGNGSYTYDATLLSGRVCAK